MEKLAGLLADDPRFGVNSGQQDCAAPAALPVVPAAEVALGDVAPVLDHAALDTFIEEIELDGVRATLDVYLEDTVSRLAMLRKLSCESDRDKIEIEAHTLKGSSSTFGLTQLSTLGRTLEYAAHEITPADYRDLVDRIDAVFAASRDAVEAAMSERVA
jgi:HPt (histidine-containing phosphotransfer) domain-containing protein